MRIAAISPIDPVATQMIGRLAAAGAPVAASPAPISFTAMLSQGVESATTKLAEADRLLSRAAVDDSIPLHQVTYALEEARISFELMIQVRNRLIDASQQLMNMQL